MTLSLSTLQALATSAPADAWRTMVAEVLRITSEPLSPADAHSEITRRDRTIGELDLFLAAGGWELWGEFGQAVEPTADRVTRWWAETHGPKALLILDALSLRELPWLLQGAQAHGFTVHEATAYGAELPGDTNEFARALGYSQRSQLQNNNGCGNSRLPAARTESVDVPWQDSAAMIGPAPTWVFWHHWPDHRIHEYASQGQGIDRLTREIATSLIGADFWAFVERLATGRRLLITSDHGYAATGLFRDAPSGPATLLKQTLGARRSKSGLHDTGPFLPPVALQLNTRHGDQTLALGRWKWPVGGGYPTLAHGGLSLLEVLTPFVELSR